MWSRFLVPSDVNNREEKNIKAKQIKTKKGREKKAKMEFFGTPKSSRTATSAIESVFIDPDEETLQFIEKHQKLQHHMMKEITELERNAVLEQERNVRHVLQQAEYFERKRITERTERRTPSKSSLTPRRRPSTSLSRHKSSHGTRSRTSLPHCMPLDVSGKGETSPPPLRSLRTTDGSSTENERKKDGTNPQESFSSRFHPTPTAEGIPPASYSFPTPLQSFTRVPTPHEAAPPPFYSNLPVSEPVSGGVSQAASTSAFTANVRKWQRGVENGAGESSLKGGEGGEEEEDSALLFRFLATAPPSPPDRSPLQKREGPRKGAGPDDTHHAFWSASSSFTPTFLSLSPPPSLSAPPIPSTPPSGAAPPWQAASLEGGGDVKEAAHDRPNGREDHGVVMRGTNTRRPPPPPPTDVFRHPNGGQRPAVATMHSTGPHREVAITPSSSLPLPVGAPARGTVGRPPRVTFPFSPPPEPALGSSASPPASSPLVFASPSSSPPPSFLQTADGVALPEKAKANREEGQEGRAAPHTHRNGSGAIDGPSAVPPRRESAPLQEAHVVGSGAAVNASLMLGLALRQPLLLLLSLGLWVGLLLPNALEMYGHLSPSPTDGIPHGELVLHRLQGLLLTTTAMCLTFLVFWCSHTVMGRRSGNPQRGFFFASRRVYSLFLGGGWMVASGVLLIAMSFSESTVLENTSGKGGMEEAGGGRGGGGPSPSTPHVPHAAALLWQSSWVWYRVGKCLQGIGVTALCTGWLALTAVEVGLPIAITWHAQLVLLLWPGTLWGVFSLAPYWTSFFVSEVDVYRHGAILAGVLMVGMPLGIVALLPPSLYSQATGGVEGEGPPPLLPLLLTHSHRIAAASGHASAATSRTRRRGSAIEGRRRGGEGKPWGGSSVPAHGREGFLVDVPCVTDASVMGGGEEATHEVDAAPPPLAHDAAGTMKGGRSAHPDGWEKGEARSGLQMLYRLSPRFVLRVFMVSTLLTAAILVVHTAPVTLTARFSLSDPRSSGEDLFSASDANPTPKVPSLWYPPGWFARLSLFFSYDGFRSDSPEAVLKIMATSAVVVWPMGFIPSLVLVVRHYCPIPAAILLLLMTWGLSFSFSWFPMTVTAIWSGIALEMVTSSVVRAILSTGIRWTTTTTDGLGDGDAIASAMLLRSTRTTNASGVKQSISDGSPLSLFPSPNTNPIPGTVEEWPTHKTETVSETTHLLTTSSSGPASVVEKAYGSKDGRADVPAALATPTIAAASTALARGKGNVFSECSVKEVEEEAKKCTGTTAMRENDASVRSGWQKSDLEDVFVFSSCQKGGGRRGEKRNAVWMNAFDGAWESFLITCACLMVLLLVLIFSTAVAWALLLDVEASSADHSPTFAGGVTEEFHGAMVNVIRGLGILVLMAQVLEVIAKRNQWNHLFTPFAP